MTLRLTNSEMVTWRDCRRKWWLAYERGLRRKNEDIVGSPLTIGNTVHAALDRYYASFATGESFDPMAFIIEKRDTLLAENPLAEREILKEYDLCHAMVEGYMLWLEDTGADEDFKVLATETKMEIPLQVPGFETVPVTILSKLDARIEQLSTGERLALEHKTAASLTMNLNSLQMDSQLLTEHLVEFLDLKSKGEDIEKMRAKGVLYNMLRKVKRTASAKPPFYGRELVMHNITELRNHWYHVVGIAQEILTAKQRLAAGESPQIVVYPSPNKDCHWKCPFYGICPLFDDGSDVEQALTDLYEVRDPLERYENTTSWEGGSE